MGDVDSCPRTFASSSVLTSVLSAWRYIHPGRRAGHEQQQQQHRIEVSRRRGGDTPSHSDGVEARQYSSGCLSGHTNCDGLSRLLLTLRCPWLPRQSATKPHRFLSRRIRRHKRPDRVDGIWKCCRANRCCLGEGIVRVLADDVTAASCDTAVWEPCHHDSSTRRGARATTTEDEQQQQPGLVADRLRAHSLPNKS
jgi:hypothetical protein